MIEKSLVLMKPDTVKRGIVGEILSRLERPGLKIVGTKLVHIDSDFAAKHYNKDDVWAKKVGGFNIKDCETLGLAVSEVFGTEDPVKIGHMVNGWVQDYLSSGPVLAVVFEGPHAVAKIRHLVGSTFPNEAPPGTIRGDYELDSTESSLQGRRSVYNLVHASGEVDEAKEEIDLWFDEDELLKYKTVQEDVYNS